MLNKITKYIAEEFIKDGIFVFEFIENGDNSDLEFVAGKYKEFIKDAIIELFNDGYLETLAGTLGPDDFSFEKRTLLILRIDELILKEFKYHKKINEWYNESRFIVDCSIDRSKFLSKLQIIKDDNFSYNWFMNFENKIESYLSSNIDELREVIISYINTANFHFNGLPENLQKFRYLYTPETYDLICLTAYNKSLIGNTNIIKPNNNIGRNELCPCGSGEKYKKCCLNKNS